jgi:hypothetical protein
MTSFAVTWDYRCPFARNAHEHIITGLEGGADWDVTFLAFSLGQAHVEEGGVDVWDEPEKDTGLIALQAGVVVRDLFPDQFLAVHRALFALRHEEGSKLGADDVRATLTANGVDADAVFARIDNGDALATVRDEHTAWVKSHNVWGVPTFITGDDAVFIRFMHRPEGDVKVARNTIDRVVDLLEWSDLNEYKHTSIPR